MDLNHMKEKFSSAYLIAVAAVVGLATTEPRPDLDSTDWTLSRIGGNGRVKSPKLDVQLKCTAVELCTETHIRFKLDLKNYDDLREEDVMVPRILMVVVVPEDPADWLDVTEDRMIMRRCGYWTSLRGAAPTNNKTSVTIEIPRLQVFSPEALQGIMSRLERRDLP